MRKGETVVISVGGSLIVPDQIDTSFLQSLRRFITDATDEGVRFVLIAGGGKTSRRYAAAASEVATLTNDDLDWLGLHATRLNGHLLRTIFRDLAHPVVITNPDEVADVPTGTSVIIAAGYRPGSSTDYRAVQIAERVGAARIVNLSNIDYVYTGDPRTEENAEKIEQINWREFRSIIPAEWDPNLSSPFDPVAAKAAEENGVDVAIINGTRLEAVQQFLADKPFTGTLITPQL